MAAMSEGSQLRKLISLRHQLNHVTVPYFQIWLFIENQLQGGHALVLFNQTEKYGYPSAVSSFNSLR